MLPRYIKLMFLLLLALSWGVSGSVNQPEAEASVAAQARPQTEEEKKIEVGRMLLLVRPGMTRRQVEELLGPPGREDRRQHSDCWDLQPDGSYKKLEFPYVMYYCSPPNLPPGSYSMTVGYRSKVHEPIPMDAPVIEVSGPHYPN